MRHMNILLIFLGTTTYITLPRRGSRTSVSCRLCVFYSHISLFRRSLQTVEALFYNAVKPLLHHHSNCLAGLSTKMEFYGFTFYAGDFVSLFSLFFDNLKTLLGLSGAILALSPTSTLLPEIVYQRVVPAAGIMLFLGSSYYSYQAVRMTKKYNKHYTAQPYGLNTAGGFPFVFGIIYGVYFSITPSCVGDAIEATGYDPIHRRRMTELSWRGGCVSQPISSPG